MDYAVVIPARYDAVRLPGKPLADIGGRPMIQWVHEAAAAGGAAEVIVATDDERIVEACARFGARAEMTATAHASGTTELRRWCGGSDGRMNGWSSTYRAMSPCCRRRWYRKWRACWPTTATLGWRHW